MAARKPKAAEPEDNTVWVTIEGTTYEIDPSDLSWGEAEEIELYFDCAVDDVDWQTARGLMVLGYLARKRVEPTFMLADMKRLKAKDVEWSDKPRPTDSEGDESGQPS